MTATQEKSRRDEVLRGGTVAAWNGDLKGGTRSLHFELGTGGELPLLWPGGSAYGLVQRALRNLSPPLTLPV